MKFIGLYLQLKKWTTSYFVRLFIVFITYYLVAQGSSYLQSLDLNHGQLWVANGIALSFIFLWGYSIWPGILVASLLLNTDYQLGLYNLWTLVIINLFGPMFTAYYCYKSQGFDVSLNRLKDIIRGFMGATLAGFFDSIIALFGAFISKSSGFDITFFLRHWCGRSLGLILITPLVLIFAYGNSDRFFKLKNNKSFEFYLLSIAFVVTISLFKLFNELILVFACFPLTLWAAIRYGQRVSLSIVFIISIITIFSLDFSPNMLNQNKGNIPEALLYFFLISLQMVTLVIGTYIAEYNKKIEETNKEASRKKEDYEFQIKLLAEEKKAAELSSQLKTEFLANVSHEIRTPLAAILGFSEILASSQISAHQKKECLEVIKRNGEQLTNVIKDVLDLSKIQAGRYDIYKKVMSIEEFLNDIRTTLKSDFIKKHLVFGISIEPTVPQKIYTDTLRLRQIILNILINAIKFTELGKVELNLKMIVDSDGGRKLGFSIKDTGVGIAEDKKINLFQAFSGINTSPERRFGGTGLGLALSKKLSQALGGDTLLLHSELGRGSEFLVTIDPGDEVQIAAAEKIEKQESQQEKKKKINSKFLENKKVLIVDDNKDNQNLLNYYLKSVGAQSELASNGHEAIEKIHEHKYDLVIMDLQMPVMGGFEACHILRLEGYKKPIVALSADAMVGTKEKSVKNGFDAYISKPIERKKFIQSLIELGSS